MNPKPKGEPVYQVMVDKKSTMPSRNPPISKLKIPGVHVIPDTVACEGTTTVSIIFDEISEPLASAGPGQVEVSVRSNKKIDRIQAIPVNKNSFCFTAPENCEGEASVVIFVNNAEVASSHMNYCSNSAQLINGLSQIYLQLMGRVCRYMFVLQTKHGIPPPMPELDQFLAEWFENTDTSNRISPRAFEELFDILRHSPTDKTQNQYELPTLLHLAAEFGLDKLATKLIDLPGATRACNVLNNRNSTASKMARDSGHELLSKMLDTQTIKGSNDLVTMRIPPSLDVHGSKTKSIMPQRLSPAAKANPDYMLPDSFPTTNFEDNYDVLTQSSIKSSSSKTTAVGRPPVPNPCPRSNTHLSRSNTDTNTTSTDLRTRHQTPVTPTRPDKNSPPPVVPRRESRDSGAYVDGVESHLPPPNPRNRPPLTRFDTEPAFAYNESGRFDSDRRKSENTVTPKVSNMSGQDIARQLSRQVLPQPGSKGPSKTQ